MDKPIIGIIGGIGSGKSFVARMFGELGGMVLDSDQMVHEVYEREDVKETLRGWWGESVFRADGSVDRRAIARRIFSNEVEKRRLEGLIHPLVNAERCRRMEGAGEGVRAFVWDTPLLVETNLHRECDAVVFVECPWEIRLERVKKRGWDAAELMRREKSQMGLDKKRKISEYTVRSALEADSVRDQVREVFSRIIAKKSARDG